MPVKKLSFAPRVDGKNWALYGPRDMETKRR